jgi:hypothetical protein
VVKNFSGQNRPGVVWLKWQGDLSQLFLMETGKDRLFRQGNTSPLNSSIPTVVIKRNGYHSLLFFFCKKRWQKILQKIPAIIFWGERK